MLRCLEETLLNELNKINMINTKVLLCRRNNNIKSRIHLQNQQAIEQVEEFTYLVSTYLGRSKREIINRICQAKISFNQKEDFLLNAFTASNN